MPPEDASRSRQWMLGSLTRKLFIKTYGCQMNVYDSVRMADVLAPIGFDPVETPDDADMVILNTCHIREKASEKVYSELGRLRDIRDRRMESGGTHMTIAVAGCVAQAEGEEMLRRAPHVDIVFGPQTYHRLPEMVARAARAGAGKSGNTGAGILDTEFPAEPKFDFLPRVSAQGTSAFLSIQEGCDKFCTFCVVPYTRGGEYSRPVEDVMAEAKALAADGVREITLLGQNVNAYHGEAAGGRERGLGDLIRGLAEIDGLARLRYTTSHPCDMDDSLLSAHGEVKSLMPFLHLPVQSGSDHILTAMNRRYCADDYRRIAERLREARPDMALASDFIVGFPGESDADFEATLGLVRHIEFAQAYSFKFSARPGTPAALLEDQVNETVAAARLEELQALLDKQQEAFNRRSVGRTLPVLLDRPGRKPGQLAGRSPYMQAVHVAADSSLMGSMASVLIDEARANSLGGCLGGGPGDEEGSGAAQEHTQEHAQERRICV